MEQLELNVKNQKWKWIPLLFLFLGGLCLGMVMEWIFQIVSFWHKQETVWNFQAISLSEDDYNAIAFGKDKKKELESLVYGKVLEAYSILSKNYYHFSEHQKSDIENGIIRGLVNSLEDKHSEFFTLDESKQFHEVLAGDFEWIGAVIDDNPLGVIVDRVLAGSPAKEAGLVGGDIIIKVDTTPLAGMKSQDAVKIIRWPANSIVTLTVYRQGEQPFEKKITRKKITLPSVVAETLTGTNIGYIMVSMFGENTDKEFTKELNTLMEKNMSGIIIDLRDNGGWILDVAINILGRLIEKDKALVITKENNIKNTHTYFSEWKNIVKTPIVVLVNENSASASEIVAGALKDYKKAVLVGKKTYGKWSVQQPFPLTDGSELKITVAKWYTPLDKWIDGIGIEPDVSVDFVKQDFEKRYDRQLETAKSVMIDMIQGKSFDSAITLGNEKVKKDAEMLSKTGTTTATGLTASGVEQPK